MKKYNLKDIIIEKLNKIFNIKKFPIKKGPTNPKISEDNNNN